MVFFRVTQNINIKTTDGTIINYYKLKIPINLENETVYITTYDDFIDIQEVFARVDEKNYQVKTLFEANITGINFFPKQIGVLNTNELIKREELKQIDFLEFQNVDIFEQLKDLNKDEISIAIIGGLGKSISDIISSCTALRILHTKLKRKYKSVKLDIYINASNNSYYSRDKDIYLMQDFINSVAPLSLSLKKLSEYDCFIDNSINLSEVYKELNIVDAWLLKFGIDYKKIPNNEKYNFLNISKYTPQSSLQTKIKEAKLKGKLLLFHPYSANINKSIPQQIAVDFLKELLLKLDNYVVISALQIDNKIKDDNFIDLSKESKSINDFVYIVSSADKIISADTSIYHISDAFMIPTITFFVEENFDKKVKYYTYTKPIFIKDVSKNLSKFIYENDSLTFYKFDSWKKVKIDKIIKLLDSF